MPRGEPVRSRLGPVKGPSCGDSASGSQDKRCFSCSASERRTKETVHVGMSLIRVRYGLPYSELPDLIPAELGRYLNFLLQQGKERTSVAFPRRQLKRGENGLCDLQRLRRHERWELAHSVSSIKRNLPAGCVRHTPSARVSWEARALSTPPPSSPEYLAFVRAVVTQALPAGWDRDYARFVGDHLPNATARVEKSSRADRIWSGRRGEFFNLAAKESEMTHVFSARYKDVLSAGKMRPLLIPDERIDLLGPVHKCLYAALRRNSWCLCGPPTEERMTSVCVGRYQTSVDLVNATDNLSLDVTRAILDAAFFTSVKIPRSVRRLAYNSLAMTFESSDGSIKTVQHGQMMGTYLSFPLLCLHSYCAARWAARFDENARFLVNGDDCVISATRAVVARDYPLGYQLNDGKTIRAENVVEVNSTAFLRRGGKWREVRHLRRGGAVASDYAGMMHIASAVRTSVVWSDAFVRSRIGKGWGFMPSQLELSVRSHAAFKRERNLRSRRNPTCLPSLPLTKSEKLMVVSGRRPTPVESEAVRSLLWETGREGGGKRDEYAPSRGHIRRTYSYRACAIRSNLSFVSQILGARLCPSQTVRSVVPRDFVSEEESWGLTMLDLWRDAVDSLACE